MTLSRDKGWTGEMRVQIDTYRIIMESGYMQWEEKLKGKVNGGIIK